MKQPTIIQLKNALGAELLRQYGYEPKFTKAGRLTSKSTDILRELNFIWDGRQLCWKNMDLDGDLEND